MKSWKRGGVALGVLTVVFFLCGAAAQQDKSAEGSQQGGEEKKAETASAEGDPANGETAFAQSCLFCHEATSDATKVGPGLKDLFKKPHTKPDGTEHPHTVATIREVIEQGAGAMPPMKA